jgi:hypothetical protein
MRTAQDENIPEIEKGTVASRKVYQLFYGIPTGSLLLQCFIQCVMIHRWKLG